MDAYWGAPTAWPPGRVAAVLRAVADQVAPDEPDYMRSAIPDAGWWDKHDLIRAEILAIADELGPKSPTP